MTEKIEESFNHIIYEAKPKKTYELFIEVLKKGRKGLIMTTTFPKKIQTQFEGLDVKILWMSEAKAKEAVNPRRLDFEVIQELNKLLKESEKGVVLIDCFGYLVLANGFDKVRKFLKNTLDLVSINEGTFLLVIDPEAFASETAQALAQDFDHIHDLRKTQSDESQPTCTSCGASIKPGAFFCEICGHNLKGGPDAKPKEGVHPFVAQQQQQYQPPPQPAPAKQVEPRQETATHQPQVFQPPPQPTPVGNVDWYSRGVQLERQGKYQEAVDAYEKAIQQNPSDVRSIFNKGVALQLLNRADEALKMYDMALAITPNDVEILSNKGIALRGMGRIEEAIAVYDRALDISPLDAGVWSNKGVALRALGRTEESIACYQKALEANPSDAGVWSNLGVAFHKLNNLEKAVECYDKALRFDPNRTVARKNREIALAALGR